MSPDRTLFRRSGNRDAARAADNQRRFGRFRSVDFYSKSQYIGNYGCWGQNWKAWSCATRLGYDGTWRNTGYPFPERQEEPCL